MKASIVSKFPPYCFIRRPGSLVHCFSDIVLHWKGFQRKFLLHFSTLWFYVHNFGKIPCVVLGSLLRKVRWLCVNAFILCSSCWGVSLFLTFSDGLPTLWQSYFFWSDSKIEFEKYKSWICWFRSWSGAFFSDNSSVFICWFFLFFHSCWLTDSAPLNISFISSEVYGIQLR